MWERRLEGAHAHFFRETSVRASAHSNTGSTLALEVSAKDGAGYGGTGGGRGGSG